MGLEGATDESDELPSGWRWVALRDVCDVNPKTPFDHVPPNASVSFIPMASVEELTGRIDSTNLRAARDAKSGYTRFASGDVIFAKITPCMENGKIAIIPPLSHDVAFGSSEYHVLRPHADLDARYLFHYLTQQRFRNLARRHMSGAVGQQRVPTDYMREAKLPLPPLAIQHRIVARIEELFGEVEAGEQELAAAKADLKRYRRAVLKAAVTGELTRDWREQNPPNETGADLLARILKERRVRWEETELAKLDTKGQAPKNDAWKARYPGPVSPNTDDLFALPEGWVWASVDQVSLFYGNGLSKKPSPAPPGEPILRISAVRPMSVDQSVTRYYPASANENLDAFRARKGDLLFTRYNGSAHLVGVCGAYRGARPILYPDKIMRAVPVVDDLGDYFEVALNAGASRDFIESNIKTTAGQQGIAGSAVRTAPIPLPPSVEARLISESVNTAALIASELETELAKRDAEVSRLRQSILAAAFSGKLISKAKKPKKQEAA